MSNTGETLEVHTLREIDLESLPTFWYGKVSSKQVRWGNWYWEKDYPYSLVYKDKHGYETYSIELLEGFSSARNLVFWLHQLLGKGWTSDRDMANLLRAFEDLTGHDTHLKFYHAQEDFDVKKQLDKLWEETFGKAE
jgi:hypothetical protein